MGKVVTFPRIPHSETRMVSVPHLISISEIILPRIEILLYRGLFLRPNDHFLDIPDKLSNKKIVNLFRTYFSPNAERQTWMSLGVSSVYAMAYFIEHDPSLWASLYKAGILKILVYSPRKSGLALKELLHTHYRGNKRDTSVAVRALTMALKDSLPAAYIDNYLLQSHGINQLARSFAVPRRPAAPRRDMSGKK